MLKNRQKYFITSTIIGTILFSGIFTISSLLWTTDIAYDEETLQHLEFGWPISFYVQNQSRYEPPYPYKAIFGYEMSDTFLAKNFLLSFLINFLGTLTIWLGINFYLKGRKFEVKTKTKLLIFSRNYAKLTIMLENKKSWLTLGLFLIIIIFLSFILFTKNSKNFNEVIEIDLYNPNSTLSPLLDPEYFKNPEWVSYEEKHYGFSFSYPKGSFMDDKENESGKILSLGGVESLKPLGANEPYTADFFVWHKNDSNEGVPSGCPLDWFENYTVFSNKNDIEIYSGTKKFVEGQEGDPAFGGQQIYCLERSEYTLFISGEDRSDKNILNQIIDSISFD